MATEEQQSIHFRGNNGAVSTIASLHFTVFDDAERLKRALSRLGLCWLAALGSVFIIILHWVLVPGFVIAGPIMAVSAYRTNRIATKASGICPVCS